MGVEKWWGQVVGIFSVGGIPVVRVLSVQVVGSIKCSGVEKVLGVFKWWVSQCSHYYPTYTKLCNNFKTIDQISIEKHCFFV